MKTILSFVLFLLVCSIGVTAQRADIVSRINNAYVNGHHFAFPETKGKNQLKVNQFKPALSDDPVLDSTNYYLWDNRDKHWEIYDNFKYSYTDNKITIKDYSYNDLIGVKDFKTELTYDGDGNLILWIYYFLDFLSNEWTATQKKEYTYDVNGNLTTYNETFLYYSLIMKKHEYENTYNAEDKLSSYIDKEWDDTAKLWVNSKMGEFNYDENGNNISFSDYVWQKADSQWINNEKLEFAYDDVGTNISYISCRWEVTNRLWVNNYKEEYSWDAAGDLIINTFSWDQYNSQWINETTKQFTSDADGNILSWVNHGRSNDQWLPIDSLAYYYSGEIPTLGSDIHDNQISVYPNPASNYVVFDLARVSESATVELFGMDGKKVLEQKLSLNKQVSVSTLTKGLYMYKVNNGERRYTGKLLVK
jgi:hypothetical protein